MSRRIFAGVGRDAALAGIAVLGVALAWSEPARAQEDPGAALPNAAAVPRWQFTPSIAVTQGETGGASISIRLKAVQDGTKA